MKGLSFIEENSEKIKVKQRVKTMHAIDVRVIDYDLKAKMTLV